MDDFSSLANRKLDTLLQLLPKWDFYFLKAKSLELATDETAFEEFIHNALSGAIIQPSVEQPVEDQQNMYQFLNCKFDVESYLRTIPDPFSYFDNLRRSDDHKKLVIEFLKDRFREVNSDFIKRVAANKNFHILHCVTELQTPSPSSIRSSLRPDADVNFRLPLVENFRHEVLLLDYKDEIERYMKHLDQLRKAAVEEGEVFECECCWADDLLPKEIMMCTEAHIFCKICVERSVSVRIGDGLNTFPCIRMGGNCSPEGVIPLSSIKELLDVKSYNKLLARIQEEEVRKAQVPGIEYCQRCEYAVVPRETDLVFKCAKCDFEICRLCNQETHVPRKCGESAEEDAEKQIRKENEERATEKVLRRCGGCKKPYVKNGGCNIVTCTCGTGNCYICGMSHVSYDHDCRRSFVRRLL